ncbi:MAG TPA: hypothetical protein VFV51_19210 [Vicinamibacterales bacterium]|nr:hypothetical protein [Vicinamibacterales bacterium]
MATSRSKTSSTSTVSASEQLDRPNGTHRTGNGSVSNGGTTTAASDFIGGIKQNVTSRVDEQKNRAADGLGGIANVIRNAGNELRSENEALASYVDAASDQLRRFADQIREKGVADMLDDVHSFARRRPVVFVGGAFLVGLGIARFLKSSAERDYDMNGGFSDVDPMTTQSVPSYGTSSSAGTGTGFGEAGSY